MNCQETRELIEDAIDKRLAGGVKRRFDLHLAHCRECRRFYEAEQAEHARWFRAMNDTAAEPPRPLPPDFADRLVASVLAKDAVRTSFFRRFHIPRWARIAASLTALASFAALAAVVGGRLSSIAGEEAQTAEGTEAMEAVESAGAAFADPAQDVPPGASVPDFSSVSSNASTKGVKKMNARKATVVALAAAALTTSPASAATTLAWSAGAADLGGKIAITYDTVETGKIKTLVATPADGETLTVTGDAMTFAAGATISMAADGKLIFANDVTADGALALNRTDGAYCDWTATKADALSKDYCLRKSSQEIFANKSLADWELVNAFAYADATLARPISKNKLGNKPALTAADAHGTWSYSNIAGVYSPIKLLVTQSDGAITRKEYVMNRWSGEYTYSARVWLDQKSSSINAKIRTAVCGGQFARSPGEDLWRGASGSSDLWTGWYGDSANDHANPNYFGAPHYLAINRVVIRRIGSDVATVGFSGAVTLGGRTDVALGVRFAVLPKENSTFAAPVFSGEGDVEYQRNTTLANVNLMKYASNLSVSNAQVTVTHAGAFPTNAVVDVWKGGVIVAQIPSNDMGTSGANGISGGWADIAVRKGGSFRRPKGYSGGINQQGQLVEVDGGDLWFDYDNGATTGSGANRYVKYLTLLNGGELKGANVRVGNDSNNQPYWHVTGSSPSTNNSPLTMVGAGAKWFTIDVDDVAEGSDFVCNQRIQTYSDASSCTFIKEGAGTMEMNGNFDIRAGRAICVYGGTLLLGASSGFMNASTSKDITLDGGALAKKGGAQTFGVLSLGDAGGTLELSSANATMAFADSSAAEWSESGTLYVKNFRDKSIRFGTSANALTEAQQRRIRREGGGRLYLDEDGYLAKHGMAVIVR